MYLKDPKTGKKSVTLTMMFSGFVVTMLKLLFAGAKYAEFSMGDFSGSDFATVMGALGAIYTARKYTDKDKE